jgi:hypothetical protein
MVITPTKSPSQSSQRVVAAVGESEVKASELAKLFFLLGQVALRQLIYVEDIHQELRCRRSETECKKK